MQNFEFPKIIPRQTYVNKNEIAKVIIKYCNDMTIRLTPNELNTLTDLYIEKYINTVNKESILNLAENIINNKLGQK